MLEVTLMLNLGFTVVCSLVNFQLINHQVCGTRCYIAPEVLQKLPYDHRADIFSFGVLLCEMIDGRFPFDTLDSRDTLSFNGAVASGARPRIPGECLPDLETLILECWNDDFSKRPSMDAIIARLSLIEEKLCQDTKHIFEEELEELPDDMRKVIKDERLRLIEVQSELFSLNNLYASMKTELSQTRQDLDSERHAKRQVLKTVKVDRFLHCLLLTR